MKDDAESAFGVGPRDGAFTITHHVAGATFEAVFIIEQDAAIAGGDEQICRTGHNAFAGRAAPA